MKQVQAVRRRMVAQQVALLRKSGRWIAMDADVLADCVLAAGGDVVVTHRLMTRWEQVHGARTPDMTAEEEVQLVAYVRNLASSFDCDCGTCTGSTHGRRLQHHATPLPRRKP